MADAPSGAEAGSGGELVFDRILLKLSGEALMGDLEYGTDPERVARIARVAVFRVGEG